MSEKLEFKGTKGEWYVERTSSLDGDFQGRILCKSATVKSKLNRSAQTYIIVGGHTKQNSSANIHHSANAYLIAAAPELLEELQETNQTLSKLINDKTISHTLKVALKIQFKINNIVINKALNLPNNG